MTRVLLFTDPSRAEFLLDLFADNVIGIVHSALRPEQAPTLQTLGRRHGVPVLEQPPPNQDTEEFIADVRALQPELIVCDSYSQRIPAPVLGIPLYGGVNVHASALPRNRGPNPTQWAIIREDPGTAVTLHRMSDRIDRGDILDAEPVPIRFSDTWVDVSERIQRAGNHVLQRNLEQLLTGHYDARPQDESRATQNPRRHPDDGQIEWSMTARQIYNLIRALVSPLPGAFYIESGARHVVSTPMSFGEVLELKYQHFPQAFRINGVELIPQATRDGARFEIAGQYADFRWEDAMAHNAVVTHPGASVGQDIHAIIQEFLEKECGALTIRFDIHA